MADSSVSSPSGLTNPNVLGVVQSPFTSLNGNFQQFTLSDLDTTHLVVGASGSVVTIQNLLAAGNKFLWATVPRVSVNGKRFIGTVVSSMFLGSGGFFGVGARESASGKALAFGLRNDAGTLKYEKLHILNDTTLDTVVESFIGQYSQPLWLQMRETGGNWSMIVSANGVTFSVFTAEGLTAYCNPDQIGYVGNSGGTTNLLRVDLYSQTYQ